MSTRSRFLAFGSAGLLVVIGICAAAIVSSSAGQIVGLALISFGCVLAVSLVFLEVGLSEDRERARAGAARRPRLARRPRPRLPRLRGQQRRLK